MNTKRLRKWFYDHNIIVREEKDYDRLYHLTYLAAVLFSLDEEFNYNNEIIMDNTYEDYDFNKEEVFLLNSINREFGFELVGNRDIGLTKIIREHGKNITCKYSDLTKYYIPDIKDKIISRNKNYYFDKPIYYNGFNVFFINFTDKLTDEEIASLNIVRREQKSFEVDKYEDKLIIF